MAKENQLSGLKNVVLPNLVKRDSAIDTTQRLAKIAGVGKENLPHGCQSSQLRQRRCKEPCAVRRDIY